MQWAAIIIFIIFVFFILLYINTRTITEIEQIPVKIFDDIKGTNRLYKTEMIILYNVDSLNIYYEIPKCSYWTIGFYDGKCIHSINMSDFQINEAGDTLHLIISNNSNTIKHSEKIISDFHKENVPYKRCLPIDISIDSFLFYVKCEIYNLNEDVSHDFFIEIHRMKGLEMIKKDFKRKIKEKRTIFENDKLFEKINIDLNPNLKKLTVKTNVNKKLNSIECLTNYSEVFDATKNFCIFAVNHFKSRSALHSHILFIDCDLNKIIKIEYTGVVTDKIFVGKSIMEVRKIKFKSKVKRMLAIERIYFDSNEIPDETGIIPMSIYI